WRSKKCLGALGLVAVLLTGLGVAWLERTPILAWYYVRSLSHASEGDRERWAQRVAGLGEPAIPGLLDCLGQDEAEVCANGQAALARLASSWGAEDARSVDLAMRLARAFPRLSPHGQ